MDQNSFICVLHVQNQTIQFNLANYISDTIAMIGGMMLKSDQLLGPY